MPGYPAFWKTPFLDLGHTVWSMPEEFWIDDSPRLSDTERLKQDVTGDSAIDSSDLRSQMVDRWTTNTEGVNLKIKVLPGRTRLLFLGTDDQWSKIPWKTWSRILQAIGHPIDYVMFYANPQIRAFPTEGEDIQAENINAGYSYICQHHTVVIYRVEEATRVLLHELLHTACFDSELTVEDLEANTEAWTEVFLCAILSKGKPRIFDKLWAQQTDWILRQSAHLHERWNVKTKGDYAWRYTLGRHEVLAKKGFLQYSKTKKVTTSTIPLSLRFTTPEWDDKI